MEKPDNNFVKKLIWTCVGAVVIAVVFVAVLTFRSLFFMM